MEQKRARQIKISTELKKEISLKYYLLSKFLPYCAEEWVSSVFNKYTGYSPPLPNPHVLEYHSYFRCCLYRQGLSLGLCPSLGQICWAGWQSEVPLSPGHFWRNSTGAQAPLVCMCVCVVCGRVRFRLLG
jgi:hypothetical protein